MLQRLLDLARDDDGQLADPWVGLVVVVLLVLLILALTNHL